MIPSLSIGPRTLLNDCNHSATAHFWRSAICTTVLQEILHSNCFKRAPKRPSRDRRGRFGTLLQQLKCGIFERTAVADQKQVSLVPSPRCGGPGPCASPDEHQNGCLPRLGAGRCHGQRTPATWHACQRAVTKRLRAASGLVLARRPHSPRSCVAAERGVGWRACRLMAMRTLHRGVHQRRGSI